MRTTVSTTLAALLGAATVAVHACGTERDFAIVRRDAIARRQQASQAAAAAPKPTDEASEAKIMDPQQECAYYSYPPVAALVRPDSACFATQPTPIRSLPPERRALWLTL